MTTFWIAASVLMAAALAFLLIPLWRQRRRTGRWSVSGVAAVLLAVPISVGLYYAVRTYQPGVLEERANEMKLVNELAERMRQQPDDIEGWRLLGRSYLFLGLYDKARDALAEAWQRAPKPDNSLKLDYAESEVLADRSSLGGEAGELIEQVLAEEPSNMKALWYAAQRAVGLGQNATARDRLTRLLQLGPPDNIAQIVRAQLEQLPGSEAAQGSAAAAQGSAAAAQGAEAGRSVRVKVRLGEGVSPDKVGPNAWLLIFARAPGGGPPVAVVREPASAVPGEFVLSDADAMIPGRSLGDFEELELVARISATGQAEQQPGDLYAERPFHPAEDTTAELVIDKVAQ
ncbi:MAG TPA: hypothetical protein VFV10_20000 [Gammaproteobacteria bacterium]|nr:hypothetical protein [Gammaproteobacteria bacterium]